MDVRLISIMILLVVWTSSCDDDPPKPMPMGVDLTNITYDPVDYEINPPFGFPIFEVPEDNLITEDGVQLGRHLFYDPILSADSTMSCSSCHLPSGSFTDNKKVSAGIDGIPGKRSSMSLMNVGYFYTGLFWDGRVNTLEEQALLPVEDPIELHDTWQNVEEKLKNDVLYPELFRKAFGISNSDEITKELAVKAIAQFERILISTGSKYDKVVAGVDGFSDEELLGFDLFFDENTDVPDAECGHCHAPPLFTSGEYFNNGIDSVSDVSKESLLEFLDPGLGAVTLDTLDYGKFRSPTLRNVEFTAPYMHDGRFSTLREVLDHYNSGGHPARNLDQNVKPLGLNEEELQALEAFIKTLSEPEFLNKEEYSNPFN